MFNYTRMKAFLMEKLLLNSTNYLLDLQIFPRDELLDGVLDVVFELESEINLTGGSLMN